MGTSQSTDAEEANVEAIIGSETKYSFLDLSSWKGSSVATLMLFLAILCAVALIAFKKYRNLKKNLAAPRGDIEAANRGTVIDLTQLGSFLRAPSTRNKCGDNCSLKQERTPAKCSNTFHLALENEAKRKATDAKE